MWIKTMRKKPLIVKKCSRCKKLKPISGFNKMSHNCIDCNKYRQKYYWSNRKKVLVRQRKYYFKNHTKMRKKWKQYYKKNYEKVKNADLKRIFNITLDDYKKILADQKNKCTICGKQPNGRSDNNNTMTSLHIDHCHASGKIRGLLCRNCNMLLGNAMDDSQILIKAIEYLDCHKKILQIKQSKQANY